jgi:hypothetical protein
MDQNMPGQRSQGGGLFSDFFPGSSAFDIQFDVSVI